jgi:chromosome segregation ATPase
LKRKAVESPTGSLTKRPTTETDRETIANLDQPRDGTETIATVESLEPLEAAANDNENPEARLPPKSNTSSGDRKVSIAEDEPWSHSQLQPQLDDPQLALDEDELLAITQATAIIRKQSDRSYHVAANLHTEIVMREVTLKNTMSQAAEALHQVETRHKTVEEQLVMEMNALKKENGIKISFQSSMDHLNDVNVTDERANGLRKLLNDQDEAIASRQDKVTEIEGNLSRTRSEVDSCTKKHSAAVEEYEKGQEEIKTMNGRHKAAVQKKQMWDQLLHILSQQPEVLKRLEDAALERGSDVS